MRAFSLPCRAENAERGTSPVRRVRDFWLRAGCWNAGVTAGAIICASGWDTNRVQRKEEADPKWFTELSKNKSSPGDRVLTSSGLPDICACDVEDKEALAAFRGCRKRWYEWLFGDDQHSISKRLTTIVWDDAIFRTLNEARRISAEHPSTENGFNADLLDLLDRSFVVNQVMALRRLTDPGFHDPKKGVISLERLLADIEENSHLLTREHYICFDGTPYDKLIHDNDQLRTFMREEMHSTFDILSRTSATSRSRKDAVQPALLREVVKTLAACGDFRDYANKFIAHAAAPSTTRQRVSQETKVTLDKLDAAYRAVVRAASFVGTAILFERSLGDVPTPQYDHLENLDKPMVPPGGLDALAEFWQTRVDEVRMWSEDVLLTE